MAKIIHALATELKARGIVIKFVDVISAAIATIVLCTAQIWSPALVAFADMVYVYHTPDGDGFDPWYYAEANPDVAESIGTDAQALLEHYWYYGIQEGRQPNKNTSYAVSASSVITLMNNYRAQSGVAACSTDSVLMTAAQERARELADNEMFAHSRPDGSKWQTILGFNLSLYVRVGENLGRGQSSATSAIYAWQHSTTHNALLLNSNMNSVGVGVAKSASGQYYFVLIAGQKR